MGKPFEIVYSPEQFNAQTNSQQVTPWGGIDTRAPANVIPPNHFTALDDILLRNATIQSRPAALFGAGPDNGRLLGLAPGISGSKNSIRVAFTGVGVYWQDAALAWHLLGNNPAFNANNPVSWRIFQNILYFTNGNAHLSSWDGSSNNIVVDNASDGSGSIGALFLDEIDNHLVLANTNESGGGVLHSQRVRWSANGLPTVWDPSGNINAGFADFLEVPDSITGLAMTGRVGQILRTNGITEMAPTGNGISPFDFNHLWASRQGIGSPLAYSLAVYGTIYAFVGQDEIYVLSNQSMDRIGGPSLDAIMSDISFIPSQTFPTVIGFITPIMGTAGAAGRTVPYLAYVLLMPSANPANQFTRMWVYSFDDHNWVRWNIPAFLPSGIPCTNTLVGNTLFPGQVEFPLTAVTGGNNNKILTFDMTNFNDATTGSSLAFRVEDIEPNRVPTVRRVILDYIDLGAANIIVTVTGTNDNGATVSSASVPVLLGGAADGQMKTKFVDLTLTAFRPQLSWTRAANAGPLSMVRAVMIGESEQVTF